MSGSEDDVSFASADEGGESPPTPVKDSGTSKSTEKGDSDSKTKTSPNKKAQKKGKAAGQTSPKKESDVKKSFSSTPKGKTSPKKQTLSKQDKSGSDKKEPKNVPEDSNLPKSDPSVDESDLTSKSKPSASSNVEESAEKCEKPDTAGGGEKKAPPGPEVTSPASQKIPREESSASTPASSDASTETSTPTQEVSLASGDSEKKGGWGWSSWGSSLITAASSSVTTFTSQVGDGISTIMDTVESSLGVPEPGELRAEHLREEQRLADSVKEDSRVPVTHQPEEAKESDGQDAKSSESAEQQERLSDGPAEDDKSWFSSWGVADLAKKVQEKGKNLASKGQTLMAEGFDAVENMAAGGIDVLENIGKKTYNTLSEHDHNLRKTRDFLSAKRNKPNLSGVLREAKDRAEEKAEQEKENEEARKAHFGMLFDDYQGIAHLEALEILSNQSEKKVHSLLNSLSSNDLVDFKPQLITIKEAFEISDDDDTADDTEQDFTSLVSQHLAELELGTAPDKLTKVHAMVKQWISDFDASDSHGTESVKSVHQRSIQSLAELTSKGVEQFHKAGELVLMDDKDKDCTERAHSLARLTGVLCHEVGNLSAKFAGCLNTMGTQEEDSDEVTGLVTNIYLEASNSSTYLQDAFQLLLPVLQHAALEHAINSRTQS